MCQVLWHCCANLGGNMLDDEIFIIFFICEEKKMLKGYLTKKIK